MGVLIGPATWLLHVTCAAIYLMAAAGVVMRQPQADLNRFGALLIFTLAWWSGCLAISHHPGVSQAGAQLAYSVGALAWGIFPSLALLFAAAFARPDLLRRPWFWPALIVPSAATITAQARGWLADDYVARPWGYAMAWHHGAWPLLFFVYFIGFMLLTLALFMEGAARATSAVKRHQGWIIFGSALPPLALGLLTDILLPWCGVFDVPNCAPDFAVIWVAGLAYAVVRYRMFELGPRFAADQLVEEMSDALLLLHVDGRVGWSNPAAAQLFRFPPDELRRRTWRDLVGEPLTLRTAGAAGRHETRLHRSDGSFVELDLSLSPLPGPLGETAGWICLVTDVTARRQAERELRQTRDALESRVAERTAQLSALNQRLSDEVAERKRSEEHHRLVVEHMHEGVCVFDESGAITQANSHLAGLLDLSAEAVLGKGWSTLVDAENVEACEAAVKAARAGQPGQVDVKLRGPRGKRLRAIVRVAALPARDGRSADCVATVMDVSERDAMQSQLARTQRLASVGLLAAGVGHEINNPLTYVMLNLEHIARVAAEGRGTPEIRDLATEALDGARRVQEIVKDLRRFARAEARTVNPVHVHDELETAIKLGLHEVRFRARLERAYAPDLPRVMASAGSLAQVFLNLIVNAAQAIPEDGLEHHAIRIKTWQQGSDVLVELADTGKGIAADDLEHLFDPFFTTKEGAENVGLGLAICHEIISSLGGRIFVGSEVGRGTRFLITLKAASAHDALGAPQPTAATPSTPRLLEAQPAPSAAVPSREPASLPAMARVLVVDDEELVARTLERVLRPHFSVVTATSGEEARRLIENSPPFDVALCDLMMPGISGMALAEWVASHVPALLPRMIFMTGGAFTPAAEKFLATENRRVLPKPFSPAEVLAAARQVLGKAP